MPFCTKVSAGFCHGQDRKGSPPEFPSLVGVGNRMTDSQIGDRIHNGGGRMPGFPGVTNEQMQQLISFLKVPSMPTPVVSESGPEHIKEVGNAVPNSLGDYVFTGYRKFEDSEGYPAVKPPWGTLNAIDLNTGKYIFKVTLGEYPELVSRGLPATGSENYGGPIATAGGLAFVAATHYDRKRRAFDSKTGKLLWEGMLPGSGVATPSTYSVDGKQDVVVATTATRGPGTGKTMVSHTKAAYWTSPFWSTCFVTSPGVSVPCCSALRPRKRWN